MAGTLRRARDTRAGNEPAPKAVRTRAADCSSTLARGAAAAAGLLLVGGALGHQLWPPHVTTIEEVAPPRPRPRLSVRLLRRRCPTSPG